jgi:hypothetical protein
MPEFIALTALTDRIRMETLSRVAAALQAQIVRDLAPVWGCSAVIGAFPFESIPIGYCPLIVQDTLETAGTSGFHRTCYDDTPYMIVPFGPTWSLAASHVLLRTLVDPTGSARRLGSSPMPGQGTVEYLLDVCGPCQDIGSAYAIDGVVVSDFCTRSFFTGQAGPYSLSGAVTRPLEPAANGIVTWMADDALLYQARANARGRMQIHGGFSPGNRGRLLFGELVDGLTPGRLQALAESQMPPRLEEATRAARRGRITSFNRFRDDLSWRFGLSTEPVAQRLPRRVRAPVEADRGAVTEAVRTAS